MNGAIRNISTLKTWFYDVGKPFFTLSYSGTTNHMILRNTATENMDEAWTLLERQVNAQAEYGRATMQVIVYKAGNANNPDGRTNIDMAPQSQGSQVAGIGSLPSGYLDENKVAGMISEAKEKWELERRLEDLEAQINNPGDWTEKLMAGIERIGATQLGQMLAMKLMGQPIPAGMVAGPPPGTQAPTDETDNFEEDIETTAAILGVSDAVLASKLRRLVETNPEMAKQLLSQ